MTPESPPFRKVLWRMIRAQPIRYSWALFLWVSIWTSPVLIGLIIAYFFDQLTAGMTVSAMTLVVTAALAYAAGRVVFIILGMRNHGSMLFRAGAPMRRNLLVRIYELPGAAALDETPGGAAADHCRGTDESYWTTCSSPNHW